MKTRHGRWFRPLLVALVFLSISLLALALEKQPTEGAIAVVNGLVITQEDFDREMSRVQRQLLNMGKPLIDSQIPKIKKEVLENLIDFELLYQETQRKGIKIDEAITNEQVMTLKKRFPSEAEFKSALTKANLSEVAIKNQIARGLAIKQLIGTYVTKKATVSGEEIKVFYESHPDLFKKPEQVRASHILIKVDPQADEVKRAEAQKKIKEIQQKLQKGEDFATLAKALSEGPSKPKGGDLGYFSRGRMVKSFEEAAFALRPNEVSDIVETKFGYHLIKVIEKRPEAITAFKDAKDKLGQYLKQQKVQKEVSIYVDKLKEKAKVERFLTEGL
ncbi:MAG: peptidylprolyl isomerase [Deltaproteobacteria bacterium]|nr:peptidylprolyl isomerase [Deltaproteobacteria bacterium]MBW2334501.1 peptidylprolyl isomerase [Deltaproteobacteria bacterium]